MNSVLKLLQHLILYPLSYLFPRNENLWAFGAPDGKFEGNAKFFYLWVSTKAPQVQAVWISPNAELVRRLRQHGLAAERRRSALGMLRALQAKHLFVNSNGDDVDFPLSGGSSIFNLWHGVGIKNILRKSTVGKNSRIFKSRWFFPLYLRSLQRFKRPQYVLSTSPMMSEHFAGCFGIDRDRCIECGYPRQDCAFDPQLRALAATLEDEQTLNDYRAAFSKIVVYAPTLRQKANDLIAEAFPDLTELSRALHRQSALLLIKLHPRDKSSVEALCAPFDNIRPWPTGNDFYTHITDLDCLITDYSSLLYDWIEAKSAGIVLYPFDYERFVSQERDLAFPYEDNIVGPRARSFPELCQLLTTGAAFAEAPRDEVERLRTRFWGAGPRRSASQKIVDFLQHKAL